MIESSSVVGQWVSAFYGCVGGIVGTIVVCANRLSAMRRDIDRQTERLKAVDRRVMLVLEIVADIARKSGADSRFSDQVIQFLTEGATP